MVCEREKNETKGLLKPDATHICLKNQNEGVDKFYSYNIFCLYGFIRYFRIVFNMVTENVDHELI